MRGRKRLGYAAVGGVVLTMLAVSGSSAVTPAARLRYSKPVCADFADAAGLYRGNQVSILGVPVGVVDRIDPQGDRVRVSMRVRPDVAVPEGTDAVTLADSIVTDRRVELIRPSSGPESAREGCIPLARTRTPLGVSESFAAMRQVSADLGADGTAGDTLRDLERAARGTEATTNELLGGLAAVAGDPRARDASLRRLIDNLDTLTTMFAGNWPDMRLLLQHLRDGLEVVEGLSANFAPMIDLSNQLLPVLARTADTYGPRIYPMLDGLVPMAHTALRNAGGIRDLLAQLATTAGAR
ncbi:MlaD family protein [Nocardia pseudobrasiliensis]|uniref:Phospholipid/cholesterol/gamma-HCH transport system substrate-binding protein n=1 Tax=Nocardia pseudobrasiliensis TaxID=45979 RepID=A0A370HRY3_9NOCA|nr:MlaD family protein [Nocardia pseudobrasiliensis]RDI61299.1 phospholipid/cholesterol/gamma-HCH transport system substrate-binding protein [Nocardia pseudobrasiliensis]